MKIGFACQRYPQRDEIKVSTTTVDYISRMPSWQSRFDKLSGLATRNALATEELIREVGALPETLRMVRLGSGLWPLSDHPLYEGYDRSQSRAILRRAGRLAQELGVRLSFHPGQFNVLASNETPKLENTLRSLEEHGEQAELVGASVINIHLWGKGGIPEWRENVGYLSERTRSRLTVENDEFGVGLRALLDANLDQPIVLDPHHDWVNTRRWCDWAEMQACADTWRDGRTPKMHLSYPRVSNVAPTHTDWPKLELGENRTEVRAHHDVLPNVGLNMYYVEGALRCGMDIMCEAKHKDHASFQLYAQAVRHGFLPEDPFITSGQWAAQLEK